MYNSAGAGLWPLPARSSHQQVQDARWVVLMPWRTLCHGPLPPPLQLRFPICSLELPRSLRLKTLSITASGWAGQLLGREVGWRLVGSNTWLARHRISNRCLKPGK